MPERAYDSAKHAADRMNACTAGPTQSTLPDTDHRVIQEGTILKLAKLNQAQGRIALVFAAAAILLPGCDGDSDDSGNAATESGDTESSDSNDTTDGSTTNNDTEDPGTSTEDPTESETTDDPTSADTTTTGPVPEGLGCDMPVDCSKGEFDGSPTITTPEDIEMIAGYTSISGRLAISESQAECLTFLTCLESVGHDLNIFNNDLLTDVSGIDNVAVIGAVTDGPLMPGGTLTISDNDALVDWTSLNLIQETPFSLSISENESLETISGFEGLVGTQDNFEIRFNDNLQNISSDGLRDILFIGGACVVTNNPNLCISTIEQMCGDLEQGPLNIEGSSTANNDNGC